jgi:hypothetical protein
MDFTAFVKRWADEGNKMDTTKEGMDGDRGESSSKVVRRHLEHKTNTFLLRSNDSVAMTKLQQAAPSQRKEQRPGSLACQYQKRQGHTKMNQRRASSDAT